MTNRKEKYWFVTLNMLRDKHRDIIDWVRKQADLQDRSISSYVIQILKEKYEESENGKNNTIG